MATAVSPPPFPSSKSPLPKPKRGHRCKVPRDFASVSPFALGRVLCVCRKTLLSLAAQPFNHACARAAHIRTTKLAGMARLMSQTVRKTSCTSTSCLSQRAVETSLIGETSKIPHGSLGSPVRFAKEKWKKSWQTNMAVESHHFAMGNTSSTGPFSSQRAIKLLVCGSVIT